MRNASCADRLTRPWPGRAEKTLKVKAKSLRVVAILRPHRRFAISVISKDPWGSSVDIRLVFVRVLGLNAAWC
jgi:hypothetical protein